MNNLEYSVTVSSKQRVLLSVALHGRFLQFVPNCFYYRRFNKVLLNIFVLKITCFIQRQYRQHLVSNVHLMSYDGSWYERGGPARGGIGNSFIGYHLR